MLKILTLFMIGKYSLIIDKEYLLDKVFREAE